ncbi:MAG: hypothetical protein WC800_05230, partial [Candidatus Nanopelagicaceae bacterium]
MDLAFTFTYLVLRCLRSEVEICALSISMRQEALGALGRAVAALEGVEKIKGMTANNAANSAIGMKLRIEKVAMPEDDKIQGSPEKVIHTEGKTGGGCPNQKASCIRQWFHVNKGQTDMCDSAEAMRAKLSERR